MLKPGLIAAIVFVGSWVVPGHADNSPEGAMLTQLIADWNERTFEIAVAEDRLLTLKGLRTAAMMHLAVHDALNDIDPRFGWYAYGERSEAAIPAAAVAQAAFDVVSSQYPGETPRLRRRLQVDLEQLPDGPGKAAGITLGRACAAAVMAKRQDDGWDTDGGLGCVLLPPGGGQAGGHAQDHGGAVTERRF